MKNSVRLLCSLEQKVKYQRGTTSSCFRKGFFKKVANN